MRSIKLTEYRWLPYLLILPLFALIIIFKILPIGESIISGFFLNGKFTLDNYKYVFSDNVFWNSLVVTLKMNAVMIPVQVIVAFLLALLVNQDLIGIGAFRTMYYLPFCIALPIATVIWQMLLNVNNGVVNSIISSFGHRPIGFLNDKRYAWLTIIFISSWRGCAYWMMFFLAGLKGIDRELYEAARIDGSGYFSTLFRITIPLLRNVTLFIVVANTTANFLLFAPVQITTEGGPQGSTNVLMYEAYKSAFVYSNHGRAAVITTVLLVIIVVLVALQHLLIDDKE